MSATIIFGSKPIIPSVPNGPHHMYILYTNEAGETRILRGGPEGSSFANAMIGDLKVIDTPYDSSSIDWDANGSHVRSQPIVISSDAEMYSMINLARTEMTRINNEGYDYNLPIVDTLVAGWGGADDQNSNTVVTKLAEVMGLKSLVLNFISANNLHVPGYDATLEHSLFERTTESLYQGLKSAGNSVSDLFSGVKESVGDFFGDTKDFFFNLFGIEVKDQQSNINNSQINNSLLNFSTNLSPTSNNASANPDDFTNGTFLSGGDYTGSIPSNTLNEDGLINNVISATASDAHRPGANTLSDNTLNNLLNSTSNFIQQKIINPISDLGSSLLSAVQSAYASILVHDQNIDANGKYFADGLGIKSIKLVRKVGFLTTLLTIVMIFGFNAYALEIEDVIKTHKIDIKKDQDRCDLTFLIENDYVDIFNGNQVDRFDAIIGDYSKNNDSGITFRVSLDKDRRTKVASFYDTDRFYILKLKNGELIGSHDGYFVPFDKIKIGGQNFKLNSLFVVAQKSAPKDPIKYFYVNKCRVQIFNKNN